MVSLLPFLLSVLMEFPPESAVLMPYSPDLSGLRLRPLDFQQEVDYVKERLYIHERLKHSRIFFPLSMNAPMGPAPDRVCRSSIPRYDGNDGTARHNSRFHSVHTPIYRVCHA